MKRFLVLTLLFSTVSMAAWAQSSLVAQARSHFEVVPTSPPAIAGNALTPEKVELGKMLWFDPRLSRS